MTRGLMVATCALVLALAGPAAAGSPGAAQFGADVIDFTGEGEVGNGVTVAPTEKIDFKPLLRNRYRKRQVQPPAVLAPIEDPLPLKPQRKGCGACSSGGAPGLGGGLVALCMLVVATRRRSR